MTQSWVNAPESNDNLEHKFLIPEGPVHKNHNVFSAGGTLSP